MEEERRNQYCEMHLAYNSWRVGDLHKDASNPRAFAWKAAANQSGGYFIYGSSYATGRRCNLQQAMLDSSSTREAEAKISDISDDIGQLRHHLLHAKEAIRLENSWHRPELPEVVTLSLPLTVTVASPNDHAHELSKFVGSMFESGHGSQGELSAPSEHILSAGSQAFWYKAAIAKSVEDFGSVDVKLVNVDDRYLARPKFTPLEERESARMPKFVAIMSGILIMLSVGHMSFSANRDNRDIGVMVIIAMLVAFPVLLMAGLLFLPYDVFGSLDWELALAGTRFVECFTQQVPAIWNNLNWFGRFLQLLAIAFCWFFGLSLLVGLPVVFGVGMIWKCCDWALVTLWPWQLALLIAFGATWFFPLAGTAFSIVISVDSSGMSLFIPMGWLGLYKLLTMFVPFGALNAWPGPASFLVFKLGWVGVPMLASTIIAPWLILPMGAYFNNRANCIDGFDWEVHLTFIYVVCIKSLYWLMFTGDQKLFTRLSTLVFYIMAEMDMYTDAMFVAIATSCGSWYGSVSFTVFVVGVLVAQLCIPSFYLNMSENSAIAAVWQIMQFPMESLPEDDGYKPLAPARTSKVSPDLKRRQAAMLAIIRCVFEDLPQCFIQYLFTIHVKKNPLIVFSIATSAASSLFAVGKAVGWGCLEWHVVAFADVFSKHPESPAWWI
ncbi:unnamed protein product [Symbiodinium necroappetens]|uniref:Uncharacterized protein n=1 Tax=Symbiodinium necroappetens TaxID=1628268 RepID=A0A812UF52_9DINO|nr:unnamed protein product [Symbiodinium necroappetens]